MKSYRLLIRPEAESDLAAAYRWYEDRDAGLGEEFLRTVEAALLGVQKNPQTHQKIYKEIRRAPSGERLRGEVDCDIVSSSQKRE